MIKFLGNCIRWFFVAVWLLLIVLFYYARRG